MEWPVIPAKRHGVPRQNAEALLQPGKMPAGGIERYPHRYHDNRTVDYDYVWFVLARLRRSRRATLVHTRADPERRRSR